MIGLRVDVDTLRGTRLGVPGLLSILAEHQIKATFFFSVGPDNMGRHLWRLFRPTFLHKMLKSRAAALYGWEILLCGTFWPGPVIGPRCRDMLAATAAEGHEIGLHAWDHHGWQARIAHADSATISHWLERGQEMLAEITGTAIQCSAAPGWRCSDSALREKERLGFRYNSDCRGHSIFYPRVKGRLLRVPQIPTTLPTYDELIGRNGITAANYNQHLLSLIRTDRLNVLTIHAEVEGISRQELFRDFLNRAHRSGLTFCPLRELLPLPEAIQPGEMTRGRIPGRDGWISCQQTA